MADFNKAIKIDPQDASGFVNRGITKELIDDLAGACSDWKKAVDLGNERPAEWVKKQC